MRKTDQEMVSAVRNCQQIKTGSTQVLDATIDGVPGVGVYLHGNLIATLNWKGDFTLQDAGWRTATTKSRLNALILGLRLPMTTIYQSQGTWYYDHAHEWTGGVFGNIRDSDVKGQL